MKALSARETARAAAEWRVLRSSANSGSWPSSASERSGRGERVGRSGSVRGGSDLPHGEMRGDKNKRNGCREPNIDVSFARRAKRSSDFGSWRRMHDRVTYSEKSFPVAVIKVASLSLW